MRANLEAKEDGERAFAIVEEAVSRMQAVPEDHLVVLEETSRMIFRTIVWPIVIVGVIGNLGVVYRICFVDVGKNCSLKPLYRGALLSLAFSDLLLLTISGANTLSFLSHKTLLWALPDWCCTSIPYFQTVAVLVASLTLATVAIDRYAAIKSNYPSKGLNWPNSIGLLAGIWIVACAASYPIFGTYAAESLVITNSSAYYTGTLCIVANRVEAATAYTALFAAIFVPLAAVFVAVHASLALSIWRRNCPGDDAVQQTSSNASQFSNDNSTVSTSLGKPRIVASKRTGPTPSHVARKRRTVRVILVLIIVFGICRLPLWSFLLYKLHFTSAGNLSWYIQIVLTSMSLANAAVHPFLYTFLNEALSLVTWIRTWCTRTRRATPVARPSSEGEVGSTIGAKVPRGPYHSP